MSFPTIVADPPWRTTAGPARADHRARGTVWQDRPGGGTSRPLPYPPMTVDAIAALPVADLAAPDCALFLWTINAYVEAVYEVARAWGFTPSTLCTWSKRPMGGALGGAFGITTEHFLYARRGQPAVTRTIGTCFTWKRRYVNGAPAHSAKPNEFYELVEDVAPGPRLELFARRPRAGWDVWGNEVESTVELAVAA